MMPTVLGPATSARLSAVTPQQQALPDAILNVAVGAQDGIGAAAIAPQYPLGAFEQAKTLSQIRVRIYQPGRGPEDDAAQVPLNHLAVTSSEHGDLEPELANRGAHPVHGRVVLARVARVENQLFDRPNLYFVIHS